MTTLSNTTQLFWVFNQSIGTWLVVILLLQLHTNKNSQALSSLTFAYSSWAIFGMVPISLASIFHDGRKFKSALTFQNIAVPVIILVIYGIFYLSSKGSDASRSAFTLQKLEDCVYYALFIFLEFGIFFIIMGKTAAKYNFYYVVLIELLLLPCYKFTDTSFIMRGSIPVLFVFMTFVIKFLLESTSRTRKIILVIALIIGAVTPQLEINRSAGLTLVKTLKGKHYELIREPVQSIGKINDKELIQFFTNQYLIFNYEHSTFYKYLAK